MQKNTPSALDLFRGELKVINIGLEHFADILEKQDVRVEQVHWRPRAGGDESLQNLLEIMGD